MRAPARAAAAACLAALGCARGLGTLDAVVKTQESGAEVSLRSCPASKCVTVYVAPWCGVCRGSTPFIVDLKRFLDARGAPTRVVVGKDRSPALKAYAAVFGPNALIDPEGAVPASGVPEFIVSDPSGRILRLIPGAHPDMMKRPYPPGLLNDMAGALGLSP